MEMDELYSALAREALGPEPADDDGLGLMLLLHTHRLVLSGALSDRPGVTELAAVTQRHAAEVVASAWPDRAEATRTKPGHWYWAFNTRTPHETVEDIPERWGEQLERARVALLRNPFVSSLRPED